LAEDRVMEATQLPHALSRHQTQGITNQNWKPSR
jgi:hypothetical protein